MSDKVKLAICILLPLLVGGISGWITADAIGTWYATLARPSFSPPNYLFGPVWSVLYVLMGVSLYLIVKSSPGSLRSQALMVFGLQLFLNFWWSIIFFKFHQLGLALVEIGAIWLAIIAMIVLFYRVKPIAAYLQIPYLLWVSFATVLNTAFWWLNR